MSSPDQGKAGGLAAAIRRLDIWAAVTMMGLVTMAERERKQLTPAEARDLDLEIRFLAGLVRRDPEYVEAMEVLGEDYTRRGLFKEGLAVDQQLAKLRPDNPTVLYNLACSLSLTGQLEAAFEALNQALDCGYRDAGWLEKDPDLAAFRAHPLHRKLMERLRSLEPTR